MRLISIKEFEEIRKNGGNNLIVFHDNNGDKNYYAVISENEKRLTNSQLLDLLAKEEHIFIDDVNIRKYYVLPTNKTEDEKHSVQQKKRIASGATKESGVL